MNQADDYIIGHISAIRIALKSYLRSLPPAQRQAIAQKFQQDFQTVKSSMESIEIEDLESFLKGFEEGADSLKDIL